MRNPTYNRPRWLLLCLVAVPLLVMFGCEQPPPVVDGSTAEALAALRYPGACEYGPDLDIIVQRDGSSIRLTNRTARSYEGMQLWLNQQYVSEIGTIVIGVNPKLPLPAFINQHRESFPVGSFLQPDLARPVISAELYDPQAKVRYRLTVQPDDKTLKL